MFRFSISFSHDSSYPTPVLLRSVSADIEAPIEISRIPDSSCEWILVLNAGRLILVPGPGPLSRFLNLSIERSIYNYILTIKPDFQYIRLHLFRLIQFFQNTS